MPSDDVTVCEHGHVYGLPAAALAYGQAPRVCSKAMYLRGTACARQTDTLWSILRT